MAVRPQDWSRPILRVIAGLTALVCGMIVSQSGHDVWSAILGLGGLAIIVVGVFGLFALTVHDDDR